MAFLVMWYCFYAVKKQADVEKTEKSTTKNKPILAEYGISILLRTPARILEKKNPANNTAKPALKSACFISKNTWLAKEKFPPNKPKMQKATSHDTTTIRKANTAPAAFTIGECIKTEENQKLRLRNKK
jgi:hypothetical protein